MHNWRLLLLLFLAVFQPIASFTERRLVDGRDQCSDQPQRLLRSSWPVHGRRLKSEDRPNHHREEIRQDRRHEIRVDRSLLERPSFERLVLARSERTETRVVRDSHTPGFEGTNYRNREIELQRRDLHSDRKEIRTQTSQNDFRRERRNRENVREQFTSNTVLRQDSREPTDRSQDTRREQRSKNERAARMDTRRYRDVADESKRNQKARQTRNLLQRARNDIARSSERFYRRELRERTATGRTENRRHSIFERQRPRDSTVHRRYSLESRSVDRVRDMKDESRINLRIAADDFQRRSINSRHHIDGKTQSQRANTMQDRRDSSETSSVNCNLARELQSPRKLQDKEVRLERRETRNDVRRFQAEVRGDDRNRGLDELSESQLVRMGRDHTENRCARREPLEKSREVGSVTREPSENRREVRTARRESSEVRHEFRSARRETLANRHVVRSAGREPSENRHEVSDARREPYVNRHEVRSVTLKPSDNRHEVRSARRESSENRHEVRSARRDAHLENRNEVNGARREPLESRQEVSGVRRESSVNRHEIRDARRESSENRHKVRSVTRELLENRHGVRSARRESSENRHEVRSARRKTSENRREVRSDRYESSENRHDIRSARHESSANRLEVRSIKREPSEHQRKERSASRESSENQRAVRSSRRESSEDRREVRSLNRDVQERRRLGVTREMKAAYLNRVSEKLERTKLHSHFPLNARLAISREVYTPMVKETGDSWFDWHYLFYTLQGIYLCGILIQLLNESKSTKKFRTTLWSTPIQKLLKND